ncbi:alpha/beta hydrolase fold domain-containing protein [Streptomyces sp. NPDC002144]
MPDDIEPRRKGGTTPFPLRVQRSALRALTLLPARWQGWLAGVAGVPATDEVLDPTVRLLLAVQRRFRLDRGDDPTPQNIREGLRVRTKLLVRRPTPVGSVRDVCVTGADGPLWARHYTPAGAGRRPLLVFFHGGGFIAGDVDSHDELCRLLCRLGDLHVLSVEYRLAPEHPFPASLEDACAALRWAQQYAGDLGAEPGRVIVGGDSAGANLAAVVCQLAVRNGEQPPAAQLLLYPPVDYHADWPSRAAFAEGFGLTEQDIRWFHAHYPGPFDDPQDLRLAPLRSPDLSGLPPAVVITAAFDPLRDEGEAYADALRAAGNDVTSWRVPGMIHAFANLTALVPAARDAVAKAASAVHDLIDHRSILDSMSPFREP